MNGELPSSIEIDDFEPETVLKRDVFSETIMGHARPQPTLKLALRNLTNVPWYGRFLSQWLARREARALRAVQGIRGTPQLLAANRQGILRVWSDGTPLQLARPSEPTFYHDARRILREMRQRGVTHNDLAKPQNWLMAPDGHAELIDFQLASVHVRKTRAFRIKGYEDLRHLAKMKQRYAPHLLTPTEARIAATRSVPSRIWHATGKRLYNFVTRRLMHWQDGEGAGLRLEETQVALNASLDNHSEISAHALLSYPLTGEGVGLYLFLETALDVAVATALLPEPRPDLVQTAPRLPRTQNGDLRKDLLALIATNRTDELDAALKNEPALADTLRPLIAGRLNLTDRVL